MSNHHHHHHHHHRRIIITTVVIFIFIIIIIIIIIGPREATNERVHGVVTWPTPPDGARQSQDAQLGDLEATGRRLEAAAGRRQAPLHRRGQASSRRAPAAASRLQVPASSKAEAGFGFGFARRRPREFFAVADRDDATPLDDSAPAVRPASAAVGRGAGDVGLRSSRDGDGSVRLPRCRAASWRRPVFVDDGRPRPGGRETDHRQISQLADTGGGDGRQRGWATAAAASAPVFYGGSSARPAAVDGAGLQRRLDALADDDGQDDVRLAAPHQLQQLLSVSAAATALSATRPQVRRYLDVLSRWLMFKSSVRCGNLRCPISTKRW